MVKYRLVNYLLNAVKTCRDLQNSAIADSNLQSYIGRGIDEAIVFNIHFDNYSGQWFLATCLRSKTAENPNAD